MKPALRFALCAAALGLVGVAGVPSERFADAQDRGDRPQSAGHGYFPASYFTTRLPADAAIDRASPELVRELRNMAFGVDPRTKFNCRDAVMSQPAEWTAEETAKCSPVVTPAGINTDEFAPGVYTVTADQPRMPVAIDNPNPHLRRVMAAGVPIPAGAQPAYGSDGQLVIWQPGTDTMWEFFRARYEGDGWHAAYGGRIREVSESPGHFRDVPDPAHPGSYREQHSWGEAASSIPNLPGLITLEELRKGRIDHALVFSTWLNHPGKWVYPAQRTDGACRGEYCSRIPQGARFRLSPRYKVAQVEHPVVRMIARAVRDYGMVLYNTTGGGLGFYTEGWRQHHTEDPYQGPDGFFTTDPTQLRPTQFMREFPWERLKMLRRGTTCRDRATECPAPRWWPARRTR